jgi:hypothetical protein
MFVDQNENRDLISRALGAQIPNPGSIRSRAKLDVFIVRLALVLLGVILQRCHSHFRREVAAAGEVGG